MLKLLKKVLGPKINFGVTLFKPQLQKMLGHNKTNMLKKIMSKKLIKMHGDKIKMLGDTIKILQEKTMPKKRIKMLGDKIKML